MPIITLLPDNRRLQAEAGQSLHSLLAREGLVDAPCGGQGRCQKCTVLVDGQQLLACQTLIDRDMTVTLPWAVLPGREAIEGHSAAFDIGTTTVVCYLLDKRGRQINQIACPNPQAGFGADVISRLRAAQSGEGEVLTRQIRNAMSRLLGSICRNPQKLKTIALVGNPAMQQLFLGLPVDNLTQIPYEPLLKTALRMPCGDILPLCPQAELLLVPDISGFVGADTVAGVLACGLQDTEELTLFVDIGTNGEMVLGNKHRLLACATAAGPALEGAAIQLGMRADLGAIDHVYPEGEGFYCHVLYGTEARGICGSGLVDAIAAALDLGLLDRRGRILNDEHKIMLTDKVYMTQQDIRQVMLAKGAIAAGIQLLAQAWGCTLSEISQVQLAGAFGSCLDPESACRIGLLPQELAPKIASAGNAAGQGAVLVAANPKRLALCQAIVQKTEFLELAALAAFPKTFAKAMELPQDWCQTAKALGFTEAACFDPALLEPRQDVRDMCSQDRCRAYGKNWTCPPHCGSLDQCRRKIQVYRRGILVQTVGKLSKDIDSRGYRETEQRHLESFQRLCQAIRRQYPQALCLGTGGCRLCRHCAWPEPCHFPDKALSSMEAYGLFVTQVCRDAGLAYHHGQRTITYTACVLF